MAPIIGQYKISDFARVSEILHEQFGRIVRLGGIIGRPDLLFVYDADEIEKVSVVLYPLKLEIFYTLSLSKLSIHHIQASKKNA